MITLERMSVILLEYIDSISNKKPALRRAAHASIISERHPRLAKRVAPNSGIAWQIYKEIITAQIFKQKIWHITTLERMPVILLEYI